MRHEWETTLSTTIHEGIVSGAIGRIAELHGTYYSAAAGFGVFFEAKVAREAADFCERYEAGRDGLWLAILDGRIEGSIAIDGTQADTDGAHLRWFITSERVRGTGVGGRLLHEAVLFTEMRGYSKTYLWTFEGLSAARHLYEKAGFQLVQQQAGAQWGTLVNEQRFERHLRGDV